MNIEMNQLGLKYRKHMALENLTMSLDSDKIYGLLGRNGAGKTTLLTILASFRRQTQGTLRIHGENPYENAKIMRHVAFVYEMDYSSETEKVKGMLEAAKRYRPFFDMDYALYLAERFKLPLGKAMSSLSKGMQSAVNVTIGLAARAPVTLFDEAYLGMDAPTRELFYKELLEDHAKHPRTIIMSTHLVSEMDYLFEEVIIINKGQLVLKETSEDLLSRGATVTGAASTVDAFTNEMKVLNVQQLGGTKSAVIYGELSREQRLAAQQLGLELGNVPLQDLFIQLTEEEQS
ncbi:ABC transporter ATP-binding protein [Paenibacillus sp. 453mf]|uniref:ATP-binding cassette domain-containing protein n=1 Tax=Paenibacillus sp. 453mf TaxID=1761874 RepID=UPI0008DF1ADC|nr:ABC transporter ATP-binding protein [Paenibacillus sp. 453mf]SFS57504.1 ABC-2 type transport system ATP-binding protein [Paenibacillus sp. 453mf]